MSHWKGQTALRPPTNITINTNMSQHGWGAISSCTTLTLAGWWRRIGRCHINKLELQAMWRACITFEPHLQNRPILFHSDNVTTVAYLNKMGGHSTCLNHILRKIVAWAEAHNMSYSATHVAGVANGPANFLSCLHPQHEWHTSQMIFHALDTRWGPHTINCFASAHNAQTPWFNSRFTELGGEAVDAMQQDWTQDNNWAAPPIMLIPRVIQLVAAATIVAPVWRSCHWWSDLTDVTTNMPVEIPTTTELFIGDFDTLPELLRNKKWVWMAFQISGAPRPEAGRPTPSTC
jgi:hypothetical protein